MVGLVEKEWLETLSCVNLSEVSYLDFVEEGRRIAQDLKAQGADVVVALTHMRVPNDKRLAEEVAEIDLILGGHDHHYEVCMFSLSKAFADPVLGLPKLSLWGDGRQGRLGHTGLGS